MLFPSDESTVASASKGAEPFALTSPAFTEGGTIPATHSCDGARLSIPLTWSGAPAETKSYAVVMRDLTFTNEGNNYHWVIWDIPSSTTSLAEGVPKTARPDPPGGDTKQTRWSFGPQLGYGYMCPINGPKTHGYELTVYAFATPTLAVLETTEAAGPNAIDAVIQAEKLASARLSGSYTKQ